VYGVLRGHAGRLRPSPRSAVPLEQDDAGRERDGERGGAVRGGGGAVLGSGAAGEMRVGGEYLSFHFIFRSAASSEIERLGIHRV
jgi:hypothetical protein